MKLRVIEEWNNMTIEALLKYLQIPKKPTHELRMSKAITINDAAATFRDTLSTGDELYLPVAEEKSNYKSSYRMCEVKYEDDYLAILVKPKGVKTHPNDMSESNTLLNHAIYTLDSEYVEPIHRLDQETVGLLLVAKNPFIKKILDRMLEERLIKRTYRAKVKSHLPLKNQTIDMPIGKDKFHPNKRRVSQTGDRAVTHIVSSKANGDGTADVELQLETGRTHQIRVHLAEIGHPVIGDPLYSDSHLRQLALESYKLEFVHPFTGETVATTLEQ